jgi:hypothetical protein
MRAMRCLSPMFCFPAFACETEASRDWLGAPALKK